VKVNIPQLTFTRFLAATSIVLFHFGLDVFPFNLPEVRYAFSHANLGVSYFFVLSGFILTVVYRLVMIVVAVAIYSPEEFSVTKAVLHTFMQQAWFPQYIRTLNVPGWSLCVEAIFYLSFPLLLPVLAKKRISKVFGISLIVWVISFVLYYFLFEGKNENELQYKNILSYSYPLMHINNFILGMAGGLAYKTGRPVFIQSNATAVFLLAIAAIFTLFFVPNPVIENAHAGLMAPLFLLFILSLSYDASFISRLFSNPFLILLGEISYGIYIFQVPLSNWFYGLILALNISLTKIQYVYSYILFLFLFSAVVYFTFEKPARIFLNKSFGSK
jgi:peptidoglycan/LPS O-acetylase OafA/YrhL